MKQIIKYQTHRLSLLTHWNPENERHIADAVFKLVFVNYIVVIWFEYYYNYAQRVQLTISQHWLR